jgi:hypothetical protein
MWIGIHFAFIWEKKKKAKLIEEEHASTGSNMEAVEYTQSHFVKKA